MEAKVICKTKVGSNEITTGYFLAQQGFAIFYGILFVIYGIMAIYNIINISETGMPVLALSLAISLSALVGLAFPIFRGMWWKHKTKQQFGVDKIEYEIHFYDLYCRVINTLNGEEIKYDYRDAVSNKLTRTEKYLFIKFTSHKFLCYKTCDFARKTDYEKVNAYVSRFTKYK